MKWQNAGQRRRINDRLGIRHRRYAGITAGGRRFRTGFEIFFGFLAGFTKMNMHINQAWRDYFAGGINEHGIFCREVCANGSNFAIVNQYICDFIHFIGGINHPAVFN